MIKCLYSIKELKRFLVDFYNISGIIIGIHDFENNNAAIQGNIDKKTFCRFCCENSSYYSERCFANDNINFEKVEKERKVIIYNCHMGFSEAIIPIIIDDEVVCIIFMGQINCNTHSSSDFNDKVDRLKQIDASIFNNINISELYNAYLQTTYCDKELFKSYINIAELCARSIYNNHWIKYRTLSTFEAFTQYITDYICQPLSINEMAMILNISVSHLSRIIKTNSGMSFTEYVHREKIKHAKKLLVDTDMSVKNIALSIGFDDANYFTRLFKKYTNITCGKYRSENTLI